MSIRIKFDAFDGNGKFGGYGDVNVKGEYDDGSMMRERLAFFVFGTFMPAPKAAHATLTVNGDARGLFTLREDWDETSISEHFSQPVGPLYRMRGPASLPIPTVRQRRSRQLRPAAVGSPYHEGGRAATRSSRRS